MKKGTVKINQNYQGQVRVKQKNKLMIKNRLYNDSYLAMGFTWTGDENCPRPVAFFAEKTIKYGYGPGKVKSTLRN
jgi:hypothetical protein